MCVTTTGSDAAIIANNTALAFRIDNTLQHPKVSTFQQQVPYHTILLSVGEGIG